jgi:hypothetical protein
VDRLRVFTFVVNMFRILQTLVEFTPQDTYPLYLSMKRVDRATVSNLSLSNEIILLMND